MNNILNDNNNENVIVTENTKKLTFDGHTQAYPVYKIKINQLYYNDYNDRIITWLSKYKEENHLKELPTDNIERYNQIIENFIKESNIQAYKKTLNNIRLFDQLEPAVVLSDGRVIDGNRRFTCMRELSQTEDKFKYLEAVILDRDIEDYKKEIKLLELQLQHGREERVEYNPIDKLVGLYNDVIDTQLITEDEYIKNTNETKSKVRKDISKATLMAEFLEFINCGKQFHIARVLGLDGPLHEVDNVLKKLKTDEEKENMKNIIFTSLLLKPQGDMTRYIRSLSTIAASSEADEYIEENLNTASELLEKIDDYEEITNEIIRDKIRTDTNLIEKLDDSYEKFTNRTKINKSLMAPKKQVEKAIEALNSIDVKLISKLDENSLNELFDSLSELNKKTKNFEEEVKNL